VFGTRPLAEWLRLLREVEVPAAPVAERLEVFDDMQVVANEMFVRQAHPDVGEVTMVNVPFTLLGGEGELRMRRPAPGLGQHTDEVLRELGYSAGEIQRLRREKAVG
jgi:crotonobetainyl-CoA:carnitine CoA-transferase CaiB-like acyl-CoA transferase